MIYLDNNATTPIDPKVLHAMWEIYSMGPLNPSSIHQKGKIGKEIILKSRDMIAHLLDVSAKELYFTSSSTEGLSTLLRGFVKSFKKNERAPRLLSTKIEHNAIDAVLKSLALDGCVVDFIPVDSSGAPTLESLEKSLHPSTDLVVLSSVYSETGMMLELEAIASLLHQKKIPLLIDATAHIGKAFFPIYPGISAFTLSAHKFHGPQGIGLMFARSSFPFSPLLVGGHQERSRRAGTENVAGIVGLKTALELIEPSHFAHMQKLTAYLEKELTPFGQINGHGKRISNTLSIAFPDFDAESLMIQLDQKGVLASMGSACSSGSIEPSRVLLEMGLPRTLARSSLRFSVSRFNTLVEIREAASLIQSLLI